ncbi:MAG: ATP-binding protein [Thermodesulfobacteriota bacterium]
MSNQKKHTDHLAVLKPFRLVKFFSYTSIGVVVFTTLALAWIISNYTTKALLDRSKEYTLVLAENLSHQIFQQFVLPLALQNRQIAVQDPRQFKKLDDIVRNATHGVNIQAVTIYSKKENIVSYSTLVERIGKKNLAEEGYEKAITGENSSSFVLRGSLLNLLPGSPDVSCIIKTYIPLRKEKPFSVDESVMGVIEIVQDLSDDLEALINLQGTILVTSMVIMAALFIVLSMIVHRADLIIEERAKERRRLEEKLSASQRLASLGKMVASVSHEIKNPLGIIHSTAEILGKRIVKVAPGKEHLATIIIDETARLDGIVREFLDFARPQTPKLKDVAVNDIVRKASSFMKTDLLKRGVVIKLDLAENLPWLKGDYDQLYQALMNIIVNGAQSMPRGGEVRIATRQENNKVTVEIEDDGGGMDEESMDQAFSPFFTTKNRGTGLGLAIVKNILDQHHAAIKVESREGHGSRFTIEFP